MQESKDKLHEWIASALQGNGEALNQICILIRPQLLAFAQSLMTERVRRLTEPEDLVQQVLHDLISNPKTFLDPQDPEKLKKFLFGRIQWRLKDVLRQGLRTQGESEIGSSEPMPESKPMTGPITDGDDRRWLAELIEHLHGRTRDVVLLCGVEGHSYSSAAAILGTSPDAIRKAYERANEALKAAAARLSAETRASISPDQPD